MSWAEDKREIVVQVLSQQLPGVEERLNKVDPVLSETESTNHQDLITKALQAIAVNSTYIGRASTTTAQDKAQIKALSRQVNALIKLITKSLDDNTGT